MNEIPFCTQLTLIKAALHFRSIGDTIGCSNIVDLLNTASGFTDNPDSLEAWVDWAESQMKILTNYSISLD